LHKLNNYNFFNNDCSIGASQKGEYCQTTKECEKYIQGWLRRAAERGKLKQYCYKTNEREIDT